MNFLIPIYAHPILAAIVLVAAVAAIAALWTFLAAAIPAAFLGRYRGQAVTWVDSVGCFGVAAVILCAPVIALIVLKGH